MCAAGANLSRSIRVNGSVVKKNFSFPASNTFTEVEFPTTFVAGTNTIRIFMERNSASGGDIDYIKIKGASSAVGSSAFLKTEPYTTGITIYPNPSGDGQINFSLNGLKVDGNLCVQIRDLMGRLVFEKEVSAGNAVQFNNKLDAGVYILQFKDKSKILSKKQLIVR